MAQIIPPITTLPSDSSAAPSVEDIQDKVPSICVDYLSHDWTEEDVWASWRSMTRHKHEIANGVRLENASWRTWQKQRNKLKTISPETLNWLKDSDVTWLYGPLHTANVEPVRPLKVATTDERLGIDRPTAALVTAARGNVPGPKKPILKHRTLSEMLSIPMPTSPILESTSRDSDDDDDIDDLDIVIGTGRPTVNRTKSDSNIFRSRARRTSPPRGANSLENTPANANNNADLPPAHKASDPTKRHISFNTFVEQVIAIDEQEPPPMDDDSDDDMLEMRPSSSTSSRSSRSSRQSSTHNLVNGSEPLTIAKIAPTLLKVNGTYTSNSQPQMIYAPPAEYLSPPITGANQDFDFPSPAIQLQQQAMAKQQQMLNRWNSNQEEEDGYGSPGFDYFGGPNLSSSPGNYGRAPTGTSPVGAQAASPYGTPPVTGGIPVPAPVVPKWKQGTPDDSLTSTATSSSSSSLTNAVGVPPQQHPTRGILKVRQSGPTPSADDPPSPPSAVEFNYNPSVATGIGGMRIAGYEYPLGSSPSNTTSNSAPGLVGGVPVVPSLSPPLTEETRGRSASRGSSAFDRSTSRGTSVGSSAASISPGTGSSRAIQIENVSLRSKGSNVTPTSPGSTVPSGQTSPPLIPPASSRPLGNAVNQTSAPSNSGPAQSAKPSDDKMDVDDDTPNTPTPHSSPQMSLRTLKDASPSSLPHNTSSPPISQPAPTPQLTTSATSTSNILGGSLSPTGSDLPTADPPTRVGKSTIAHVSTNAQPTMSYPVPPEGEDDEMGDGSSIMGRAANIANTAKDLLGALWYGANEDGKTPNFANTMNGGHEYARPNGAGVQGEGGQGGYGAGMRRTFSGSNLRAPAWLGGSGGAAQSDTRQGVNQRGQR